MPLIVWAYLGYVAGLLAGFSRLWLLQYGLIGAIAYLGAWRRSSEILGGGLLVVTGVVLASSVPVVQQQRAPQTTVDTTTFLGRQRARAERTIDSVFQRDAPIAKALLVADKTQLPKEVKQRYVKAGIAHRLSISGLHVGMIAVAVEILFRLLRIPRRIATLVSVAAIGAYVALIGFPLPAVRAGAMFGIVRLSRLLQRPTSPWAILASCGFIPLVDPTAVLTIGYQLNMAGVASFMAGTTLAHRTIGKHGTKWGRRIIGWRARVARSLLVSLVATAITLPLIAWWFGQVSLIAPVTNLLVEPAFEMIQPLLFLALLFAPLHPISSIFADAVHPLLAAVDQIAAFMATIPYASITTKPAALEATLAGIASAATLVACVSRLPTRPILLAATALCALICIS